MTIVVLIVENPIVLRFRREIPVAVTEFV